MAALAVGYLGHLVFQSQFLPLQLRDQSSVGEGSHLFLSDQIFETCILLLEDLQLLLTRHISTSDNGRHGNFHHRCYAPAKRV